MPYYFGEGDRGWDDLGDQGPSVADFRYLPPPDLGGPPEPVRFGDAAQPPQEPPAQPSGSRPSFWKRLFGSGKRPSPAQTRWNQRQEQERQVTAYATSLTAGALRAAGIARAYCRYDGGNDEGWAWLDHFITTTGERRTAEDLVDSLLQTDLLDTLVAAKAVFVHPDAQRREHLLGAITDGLATDCAVQLLGSGFGTGPYYLYGAFVVDFAARTITDDPSAEPVVENIELKA